MLAHRTRWLIAIAISGAVACSFGVDLDGLVDGDGSTPTNDGGQERDVVPDVVVSSAVPDGSTGLPEAAVPSTADITSIGAGSNFTCVLRKDGTVNCWGRGTEGRLGTGIALSSSTPRVVVNVDNATELSVGANHACVLLANGTVQCWGANESRQLGIGTTTQSNVPTPVLGLTQAVKHISAGTVFACAHLADDTAMCWGDNTQGELGDGTIIARLAPVAVKGLAGIKQLAAISASACALVADGTVWCWGENMNGQNGNGAAGTDGLTATQIPTGKLSGVASLAVGATSGEFCAVLTSGAVKCWGYGQSGDLGNAGNSDSPTPVNVAATTDAIRVLVGGNYACALHKDAAVSCWGSNGNSGLALGDSTPALSTVTTPLPATGLAGMIALAAGNTHACALKDPQTVLCWGNDQYGALGRNRTLIAPAPVQVANTTDVAAIAVGREYACVTHSDGGALSCWGNNANRQQGRSDVAISGLPAVVPNLSGVGAVSAGDTSTCTVGADAGDVQCFGANEQGQLGNGTGASSQATPVTFIAPSASDVGDGQSFGCALLRNNQIYCAGYNPDGRLGRPTGPNSSTPAAVQVPAVGDAGPTSFGAANQLTVGREAVCAVYASHTKVSCWGDNSDGQLGTTGNSRSAPQDVVVAGKSVQLARMGYRHACGLFTSEGEVYCWGRNLNGQLTGTDPAGGPTPRLVDLGDAGAKDLALGDDHTCALMVDGTVRCWGAGTQGQLGNGALTDSPAPIAVPTVSGATAIRANENHTCVVTPAGVSCWGTDYAGQLGVSPTMQTGTPVAVQGL